MTFTEQEIYKIMVAIRKERHSIYDKILSARHDKRLSVHTRANLIEALEKSYATCNQILQKIAKEN